MITLPAGATKYLLTDPETIRRNSERGNAGAPVVLVVSIDAEGLQTPLRGYDVRVLGEVTFAYEQRGALCINPFVDSFDMEARKVRAAYATTAEVLLATEPGEALETPEPIFVPLEEAPPVPPENPAASTPKKNPKGAK